MLEISLNKIKKNYGFNNVLENFNLDIKTGERVALIGPNGCGKSTVLNIIYGTENILEGTVSIRKGITIGLLSQIPDIRKEDYSVKNVLLENFAELLSMRNKLNSLEEKLSKVSGKELDKVINNYTNLQDKFINSGGYEIESLINKVCSVFKISDEMLEESYNDLSGGEKTIVNLASLVIKKPSILLLDEPTNHLDIDALEWLEEYLRNYKGTVVIVSHDRYFLDAVTNKTILIYRGKEEIFFGNYSYFIKENERRILAEFENYKNQQKKIEAMEKAIKRLQEWGKQSDNPIFFKRAENIRKRLERMELIEKPLTSKEIPIQFKVDLRSGNDVLSIKDINITLGNKLLLKNSNLNLYWGEKTCLMGKNGTGKTTLINAILNKNISYTGTISIGTKINIGYIPQEIHFENEKETLLEFARRNFSGDITALRSALSKYLFYGDNIEKRVGILSGGEKVRLMLFSLIQSNCNLLILDEPTNHIDIDTREILENALKEYKGTLLFISHDRYFINNVADKIFYIENNIIKTYNGNYDYYKNHR